MTDRLYYFDSYKTEFTAQVIERLTADGRPAVVLNQTAFYPAGGGQPFDIGSINGVPVVEVAVRQSDNAVVHVLGAPLGGAQASGAVDWQRRFDHMQQHSGQHILSQAFLRAAEAETVSFHLGRDIVTIDVNHDRLTAAQIGRAEDIANDAVMRNLPVRAWFPAADERSRLALRKTPDVSGPLRVVAIGDFDCSACGGTHVANTGEIGLIKIVKVDKHKQATRVEFCCGARALADYRQKNAIANQLAADLTCGFWEVGQAVGRLRAENSALRKELKAAREQLLGHEAAQLAAAALLVNGWRVVRKAWPDRDLNELRSLAARLASEPGTVALLGSSGAKAQFVFARADDVEKDMNTLIKTTLAARFEGGRGGGEPRLAQGGGVSADLSAVQNALAHAEHELIAS